MHIITRKRLNEFAERFPETENSLARWYELAKLNTFNNFSEVFNVGGNKIRLIAAIHYNRKKIYIRAILTHTEYDKSKWKE
jgi:mRNA interferase HigB